MVYELCGVRSEGSTFTFKCPDGGKKRGEENRGRKRVGRVGRNRKKEDRKEETGEGREVEMCQDWQCWIRLNSMTGQLRRSRSILQQAN